MNESDEEQEDGGDETHEEQTAIETQGDDSMGNTGDPSGTS